MGALAPDIGQSGLPNGEAHQNTRDNLRQAESIGFEYLTALVLDRGRFDAVVGCNSRKRGDFRIAIWIILTSSSLTWGCSDPTVRRNSHRRGCLRLAGALGFEHSDAFILARGRSDPTARCNSHRRGALRMAETSASEHLDALSLDTG